MKLQHCRRILTLIADIAGICCPSQWINGFGFVTEGPKILHIASEITLHIICGGVCEFWERSCRHSVLWFSPSPNNCSQFVPALDQFLRENSSDTAGLAINISELLNTKISIQSFNGFGKWAESK